MGAGGTFVFKFKINEEGELPTLTFVYKRSWENENVYTAQLDLALNEENSQNNENAAKLFDAAFTQEGGVIELEVQQDKTYSIGLEGNPTTGYSWTLENAKDLKGVELVNEEYIQDEAEDGMVGVGGTYVFTFHVVDDNDLSNLKFAYQRSWETEAVSTAEVVLKTVATSAAAESDDSDIQFTEEGGIESMEVEQEEVFKVSLKGNPTTGYSWTLENANDLKGVELVNDEFVQDNEGKNLDGAGGAFVFTFRVTETEELSSLKFVYQRPWETESVSAAEVILNSKNSSIDEETSFVDEDEIDTPVPLEKDDNENVVLIFNQNGGIHELEVEQGNTFTVSLEGNPSTGYSWTLENANDLKGVESLGYEYIEGESEEDMVGVGGNFYFKFQVKETDELPTLKFAYMRPWETVAISTAEVTLKAKATSSAAVAADVPEEEVANTNDEINVSFSQDGGDESIVVKDGQLINVKLQGNPTTGYRWVLQNSNDLKGIVQLNEGDEYVQNPARKGMLGVGGTFVFKFQVNDANELPTLNFEYKRGNSPRSTAKVVISKEGGSIVAFAAPEEEVNEVIFSQNDTHGEISVKSNSTFVIKIKGNPTTGYTWKLNNAKELEKAGITVIINGNYTASSPRLIGSGGIYEYKFQVGDVKNLPSIKFTYKRSWILFGGQQLVVDLKPAN